MPALTRIPIIGPLFSSRGLSKNLTPQAIAEIESDHRDLIGLGDNPTFGSDAFDNAHTARITNVHGFAQTQGAGNKPIHDKINADTDAAKAVRTALEKAFEPTEVYLKAQKDYQEKAATFKGLVKLIPTKFTAESLLATLKDDKDEARKAIIDQQELELIELNKRFEFDNDTGKYTDEAFIKDLQTTLEIPGDLTDDAVKSDLETTRKNMEATLKASHQKNIANFDKSTSDSLNKLHKAQQEEMKKISGFIFEIAKEKENLAELWRLGAKNRQKRGVADLDPTITASADKFKLTGIDLKAITKFKSLSGKEIVQNPPGTFTIERSTIDPLYNQDPRNKPLYDLRLISKGIIASGYDTINWKLDYSHPEVLMEEARRAYEASILEGIEPSKIKIADGNGKELKTEDIFKNHQNRLAELNAQGQQIRQSLANINSQSKAPLNKEAVKEIREQQIVANRAGLTPDDDDDDTHQPPQLR